MNSKQEQLLTTRNTALEKELAAKNRELEIETALEKVRAIALSMKEPANMLEVCKTISQQLELLNVKEIRNVQTAIIYETKGTYFNYEFYAKHDKLLITEVDFKNHEIQEKFASQMLTGAEELFTLNIEGKELKDWYAYQKTTNQFADTYLEKAASLNYYWFSLGPVALGISTYIPLREAEINLFKRFRNVFELAYRRFIDIELAIGQTKEARLETALERVRAVAMAMRKPDDLLDICKILYEELHSLGFIDMRNSMINIHNDEQETFVNYDYSDEIGKSINHLDYKIHPLIEKQVKQIRSADDAFSETVFSGRELAEMQAFRKQVGEKEDPRINTATAIYYYFYSIGIGSIGLSSFNSLTEEKLGVLKRFRNVFSLAYQRYIDISLAEAQAREAQIELALERVRARTMAMQKSEELKEVIQVVYEQFVHLNIHIEHTGFVVDYKAKGDWHFWIADKHEVPAEITVPYFDSAWGICYNEAKEKGMDFFATHLNFEEKNKFYQDLLKHIPGLPEEAKEFYFSCPGLAASTVLLENVGLYIENFSGTSYTDEENKILMRFGKVFQQTYTRFLDLQKAEAQSRESQIQLALERARTQSMIMQHSSELDDALRVFHEQVLLLGINSAFSFLWLPDEEKDKHKFWAAWSEDKAGSAIFKSKAIDYPLDRNEPATAQCLIDWKSGEVVYSYAVPPEGVENYFTAWKELIDGVETLTPEHFRSGLYYVEAFIKYGCFGVMVQIDLNQEEKKILGRFAIEFERTYTRFLDLQKAEAQAREGQIELGLERVRARAMAMQKSEELSGLVAVLFKELIKLNLILYRCIIWIFNPDTLSARIWMANSEDKKNAESYFIKQLNHPYYKAIINGWKEKNPTWVYVLEGNEKKSIDEMLLHETELSRLSEAVKTGILSSTHTIVSGSFNNFGFIEASGPMQLSDEQLDILSRFGKVFDLTYTRFNDLKQAEAQAREAKIEAALERVRARALAMQEPEDLKEVAQVLRHEMGLLGVEELETCSIYINTENAERAECWYALKDVHSTEKKLVNDHFALNLNDTWVGREMLTFYRSADKKTSIVMQGANRKEWINYCEEKSVPFRGYYGEVIPDRTYHLYKFSHGAIGAATPGDISEESFGLLKRAASVFSLAYSRFKDLTQARTDLIKLKEEKKRAEDALTELQATQKQLIQSEKMASLGELTAGIAHEIQNPLNFVNNFSEVNTELIDELSQEVDKGNLEEVKALAKDIKENEQKINHHGKRADAIVKGMLQHSRSSSGVKEPTDINALCDEYLRLSYHGLRAKDKSFNATIKTDFDATIGNINIIPQDIGRVILNLLTNAFYAVQQKQKELATGVTPFEKVSPLYEPTISIRTKKLNNKIEIRVADNGNGIPPKVLDKIFQPFFTTKPTGQGTGLGLSLSYDIVTKGHGGELKVETREGEGTTFIIQLPT